MHASPSLGADLRSLRKTRNMTLAHVAEAVGRSVGWLSQVERGLSRPDAQDLAILARLFDVPEALIAPPPAPPGETGRIVRKTARRPLGERVPGLVEALLSPDLTDGVEVIHAIFRPGAERRRPTQRATEELAVMISGKLAIWIGAERYTVAPGDTFRIRDEPFRWANPYDIPAVAVWVISPPVY